MNLALQGHAYPPYRLKPDRGLAAAMLEGQGLDPAQHAGVPPTYFIFLRGEARGADIFRDLDIPRLKALHGGQRYEWFEPIGWDDEVEVVCRIEKVTEKESKSGTIWFADVAYEYRRVRDGALALRELTRLVKRS
jgi:hypothetical protein